MEEMRKEEAKAFGDLGIRLDRMHAVVSDARNNHKTLRVALAEAVLLYQQAADCREAINTINTAMERQNGAAQCACHVDNRRRPEVIKKDRHAQTATCVTKSIAVQTDLASESKGRVNQSTSKQTPKDKGKREASASPQAEKIIRPA